MAHSVNIPYLDNESINKYFESLAKYIIEAGIGEHRILVVGGAAMALKYIDNRSTLDVDICIQEQNNLYACCRKVTKEYSLPEDWINADVMHSESFSYQLFDNAVLYKKYENILSVYVASDIDLYCMKLISFRPKDIQDMETISKKLQKDNISSEQIEDNFLRLYGDLYLMKNDPRKERLMRLQLKSIL